MSDSEIAPAPPSDQDATQPHPQVEVQSQHSKNQTSKPEKPSTVSFSIWPPTQRTRDAVINRLIETLSTSSVLSKRYGTISSSEASAAALQIEEEAFSVAGGSAAAEDDGIEILQVYSKEISKRMLETVKSRATPASAVENSATQAPESNAPPAAASEDVSSVENES
ncbi:MFP1 attachment factor 1 [Quillaja saponaria]|uniref:MFP1 attachment factor 1 n=1 Tax=Quillaja saponaria TaxID=32244 RepID=A0AAD7LYE6_QUISA|nr:MFP1 attachment factor 1 [Quillaja saponaria]